MPSLGMRQIEVRAERDDTSENGVRFGLKERGAVLPNATIRCAKSPTDSKNNDFHDFTFSLSEQEVDLLFREPANAAMTVAGGNRDIEAISVAADRKSITVRNFNRTASENKFALNFVTRTSPQRPVVYDPIWVNQNGGSTSR